VIAIVIAVSFPPGTAKHTPSRRAASPSSQRSRRVVWVMGKSG